MKLYQYNTEIPGPTRKVPSTKNSVGDTNEVSSKSNKNQPNSGKESHIPSQKNSYLNPDYDENYSSNEEDDLESTLGRQKLSVLLLFPN